MRLNFFVARLLQKEKNGSPVLADGEHRVNKCTFKLLELPLSFFVLSSKNKRHNCPADVVFHPRKTLLMPSCGTFFHSSGFTLRYEERVEAGAYRWSISNCYGDICSPSFEMWGRKWRLFCLRRGGSIQYGLENKEGDRPIHLSVRYVCIQQILKGKHRRHVCLC